MGLFQQKLGSHNRGRYTPVEGAGDYRLAWISSGHNASNLLYNSKRILVVVRQGSWTGVTAMTFGHHVVGENKFIHHNMLIIWDGININENVK